MIDQFSERGKEFNTVRSTTQGFGAGSQLYIDGSETLRHPVDILFLELMKTYIFLSL